MEVSKAHAETVEASIQETIGVLERLYDINPSVFAGMPTAEFVAIGKEFRIVDGKLQDATLAQGWIGWQKEILEQGLKRRHMPPREQINVLASSIASELGHENLTSLQEKFEAVDADWFDRTPRQITEGYIAAINECLTEAEENKRQAEQAWQNFVGKYKKPRPDEITTVSTESAS